MENFRKSISPFVKAQMAGMKAAPPNQRPARRPVEVRVSKAMMAPASPASSTPNSKKRERSFIFPVHLAAVVGSGEVDN